MNGSEEFERQLNELGNANSTRSGNVVTFDYEIPGGRLTGSRVRLGFEVPSEFPRTPPSGPHMKPRLLPMNPGAAAHPERVADSSVFGVEGQYLSRPFPGWRGRETVQQYLAYIDHIFRTT